MSHSSSNVLETWGTPVNMNLNEVVYLNIQSSPYFKSLLSKKTYHEVIDEIYNNEPFVKGTTASSAFCLLYKLWTLKLTVRQLTGLLDHTDSPHIRALGMLYVRYICKPDTIWDWLSPYLDDEEEVQVRSGRDPLVMTIGQLCRELLTQPKWCNTMLPRIPVKIARDIENKLKEHDAKHQKTQNQIEYTSKDPSTSERHRSRSRDRYRRRSRSRSRDRYRRRSRSRDRYRSRSRSRDRYRSRSRSRDRYRRRSRSRSRSRDRYSRSSRSSRYADDRRRYHSSRSPSRTR